MQNSDFYWSLYEVHTCIYLTRCCLWCLAWDRQLVKYTHLSELANTAIVWELLFFISVTQTRNKHIRCEPWASSDLAQSTKRRKRSGAILVSKEQLVASFVNRAVCEHFLWLGTHLRLRKLLNRYFRLLNELLTSCFWSGNLLVTRMEESARMHDVSMSATGLPYTHKTSPIVSTYRPS